MNNSIRTEWEKMRCFPIFEYKISESDYLVVELSLSEDNQEMTEGYLLPNGLYCDE